MISKLCHYLIAWKGCPRSYLSQTLRQYPLDVSKEVMPFIQFYIEFSFEELVESDSQAAEFFKRKSLMIRWKNSLRIMKHFRTGKETKIEDFYLPAFERSHDVSTKSCNTTPDREICGASASEEMDRAIQEIQWGRGNHILSITKDRILSISKDELVSFQKTISNSNFHC